MKFNYSERLVKSGPKVITNFWAESNE